MKTKNEAFGKYRDFQKNLQTKYGITIKILHSDRESEFLSDKFQKYLAEQGTEQKLTVHDTPQHNGIAERAHQTIINGITSVMYGQSLPNHLWNETLNHIVYTYNWTPRATLSFKTLYKARFEIILDISSCKSWGAKVIVTLGKHTKMQLKGEEAFYIGPDSTSNGYRVWWPKKWAKSVERDVVFLSNQEANLDNNLIELEEEESSRLTQKK